MASSRALVVRWGQRPVTLEGNSLDLSNLTRLGLGVSHDGQTFILRSAGLDSLIGAREVSIAMCAITSCRPSSSLTSGGGASSGPTAPGCRSGMCPSRVEVVEGNGIRPRANPRESY
jgi:hypothetical protein